MLYVLPGLSFSVFFFLSSFLIRGPFFQSFYFTKRLVIFSRNSWEILVPPPPAATIYTFDLVLRDCITICTLIQWPSARGVYRAKIWKINPRSGLPYAKVFPIGSTIIPMILIDCDLTNERALFAKWSANQLIDLDSNWLWFDQWESPVCKSADRSEFARCKFWKLKLYI